MGQAAGLLGLGGGDPAAFQKYLNSSGYKFMLDSGSKAITGNAAARGLLNSGSTLKALTQFGQDLGSTKLDNYLGQLSNIAKTSLGAGGLISEAGQYSKGSGSSSPGIAGLIGAVLSSVAMASDRRLKSNIEKVGEFSDGLGIYEYDYNRDIDPSLPANRMRGVMADEVEQLRPWALGPTRTDGFATVNYDKLAIPANMMEFL
jgi:hypothetical protein